MVGHADRFRSTDPELGLAAAAARFCAFFAIPVLGGAWLAAGSAGLLGAGIATVLVTALLSGTAVMLAACARRGWVALIVGGYTGSVARLAFMAVVLAVLQRLDAIHMPSLVMSAIVLVISTLVWMSWHASRSPGFFRLDPRPATASGSAQLERTTA